MNYAQRVRGLTAEGAYYMLARAQEMEKAGREIIHLEIGEPDFATPEHISQAGKRAISTGKTRYNPPSGIGELRDVIAGEAGRLRGTIFKPEQILVGPGAKPALFFPTLALVDPGDEVIYPDPGFPTYQAMIEVAGGISIAAPLKEEMGFSFDLDTFDRLVNERTRLIILNSPGNPTGGVMPLEVLEHIAEIAIANDIWVISDEVYSQLIYEKSAPSIAVLPGMSDRTVICDGFSKTYAMTGWRLGFGIMPEELAERVTLLLTHSIGCTASFTQYAGIEAITGPQEHVTEMVGEYRQRRDLIVDLLNHIPGVVCQLPQGAFYAFPNVTAFRQTSSWLADYLLEEAGVALLPGTAFGPNGEGYLRICFANSMENLTRAGERISTALNRLSVS
ncbi:MAG: pyridoxal phosphate-dependent aminotransferase [Anaerolineales bacterium]|nr:pyridoxal phosphate-dependent aminotransferase [Anaerolineales bacterium]